MLRILILAVSLLVVTFTANAQISDADESDHYISVQTNPLISQILNFGNPIPVNNPFLLKYSYLPSGNTAAFGAGFGFRYSNFEDDEGRITNSSSLNFRAGYEWFIPIDERVELSIGPDLVFRGSNSKTISIQSFGSQGSLDSTVSNTRSQTIGYGAGARLNFAVKLTPKLLLGTEANYYWISEAHTTFTSVQTWQERPFSGISYSSESQEDEFSESDLRLQLPIAIFLTFRF